MVSPRTVFLYMAPRSHRRVFLTLEGDDRAWMVDTTLRTTSFAEDAAELDAVEDLQGAGHGAREVGKNVLYGDRDPRYVHADATWCSEGGILTWPLPWEGCPVPDAVTAYVGEKASVR